MNNYSDAYADLILNHMLGLKEGEKLYINCTVETVEFAHKVAKLAAEIAHISSFVVFIEKGKVEAVDEFEPNGKYMIKESGVAMLHLASFNCPSLEEDSELTAPLLQQFSLLAEPIDTERRIGVPWANVYVPTQSWAQFLLGEEATIDQLWMQLAQVLSLDDDYKALYNTQHKLLSTRCKKVQNYNFKTLELENGNTKLTLPVITKAKVASTASNLKNVRNYFPTLPCEDVVILVDKTKVEGRLYTTKPFKLFDKIINKAYFKIEKGKVVDYDLEEYNSLFKLYSEVDEAASRVGQLILCDELTLISQTDGLFGVPALDRMRSTTLSLGGVDINTINFSSMEEVEQLNINTAFVHLELPLGSQDLQIYGILENGERIQIVEDGLFLD